MNICTFQLRKSIHKNVCHSKVMADKNIWFAKRILLIKLFQINTNPLIPLFLIAAPLPGTPFFAFLLRSFNIIQQTRAIFNRFARVFAYICQIFPAGARDFPISSRTSVLRETQDAGEISASARRAMAWAYTEGLISGTYLGPQDPVTVGEAQEMLAKLTAADWRFQLIERQ